MNGNCVAGPGLALLWVLSPESLPGREAGRIAMQSMWIGSRSAWSGRRCKQRLTSETEVGIVKSKVQSASPIGRLSELSQGFALDETGRNPTL